MKKLLIFAEVYDPGGHEKAIQDITLNLPKKSIILTFNQGNPRLKKFAEENKIPHQILKLKKNSENLIFSLKLSSILTNIMGETKRFVNALVNYQYLRKQFEKYGSIDSLLILTGYPGRDSCRIAAVVGKKIGIKKVYFSILNNPLPYPEKKGKSVSSYILGFFSLIYVKINRWFDSKTNHAVDTFVVNSKLAQKNLHNFKLIPKEKIKVIYTGIDIPDTKDIAKINEINKGSFHLAKNPNEIWFGMIGNLVKLKGQEFLIKSVSVIKSQLKDPKIKVLIVGGGPDYKRLHNLIQKLSVENEVILTNTYPYAISDIYRLIDIFVFTSLAESFPYSISEAMSHQLPIISTNVGGIPEQIDDGINGLIVVKENVDQLVQKMIWLMNNRKLWDDLGKKAYLKAMSRFSIEKMVNDLKELVNLDS